MSINIATNCRTLLASRRWAFLLAGALAPGLCFAQSLDDAALATGCAGCHGTDGRGYGRLPSIRVLDATTLTQRLDAFADTPDTPGIMHRLMASFTAEERRRLAAYFSERHQP